MKGFLFSIAVLSIGLVLLWCVYCVLSLLKAMWEKFWHFLLRKSIERDLMKLLRAGKDVEVRITDYEKVLGIPIVECLRRKSMKRDVRDFSYLEKNTFVYPVLKLVDGKVILVGGVVHKKNKPKRRISVEKYLHYYDPPKPDVYRFDAKQGKYILVARKTPDQKQAE